MTDNGTTLVACNIGSGAIVKVSPVNSVETRSSHVGHILSVSSGSDHLFCVHSLTRSRKSVKSINQFGDVQ